MRTIKFRAWDGTGGAWLKPESIRFDLDGNLYYFDKGPIREFLEDLTDKIVIEQFTGLLDKNGKEIYEGDIMNDGKGSGVVRWLQESCAFVVRDFTLNQYMKLESGDAVSLKETEVIGNVHQNPELLKP